MRVPGFVRLFLVVAVTALALAAPARSQTRLRILFTHDLHSTLNPQTVVTTEGRHAPSGGFARLATALKRASSVNPDGTVIVDGGDFTMGTLFNALYLTESPELRLMGAMGYDVVTFGNHDFDFHLEGLADYLTNARSKGERLPAAIISNLDISAPTTANGLLRRSFEAYGVRHLAVIERKGVRIGVFGLMGEDAAADLPFLEGAAFQDLVGVARHTVRLLRDSAKADIVLCLSHTGTSENQHSGDDFELARRVPGIDIIISGHTHRRFQKPQLVGSTIICSAGAFGSHLGVVDVQLTPPARPYFEHYELMPIDSTLPEDTTIAGEISAFGDLVDRTFSARYGLTQNQIVAESGFDFEPVEYAYAHPGETGLGDLIADAYRYAATRASLPGDHPIDAVIVPIGMIRGSFLRGPLTVADVFQALSLGLGTDKQPGYPLVTFHVTGKDLLNTLEIETTLAGLKEDAHLQIAGIRFRYNPYRLPLNRVTEAGLIGLNGNLRPIADDQLYRVCICLYTGMMLGEISSLSHGLIAIQPRREDGTAIKDWKETLVDGDGIQPGTQELKAWMALLHYLQSFSSPQDSGPPRIPERYSTPAGRFKGEASLNLIDLVKNPNRVTGIAAALVLGLLSGVLWVIGRTLGKRSWFFMCRKCSRFF